MAILEHSKLTLYLWYEYPLQPQVNSNLHFYFLNLYIEIYIKSVCLSVDLLLS